MKKEMLISNEEMNLLMDSSISTGDGWEILLASPDETLCSLVMELFYDDDNIDVTIVDNGCDALVVCSMNLPHLVIIDEELSDISCSEVIKCLKRRSEFKDIKVLCGMKIDSKDGFQTCLCLQTGVFDDSFTKTDIDKTYLARKISSHLFSSEHAAPPKRRWPRADVNILAILELYSNSNPDHFIHGDAKVKNISRTGVYLKDIRLNFEIDPDDSYKVILKIDHPPLKNWEAESAIIRLKDDNTIRLKFVSLSKQNNLKLSIMLGK